MAQGGLHLEGKIVFYGFICRLLTQTPAVNCNSNCNLHLSADVLSEDCILKWHKEAYSSKGKSVFMICNLGLVKLSNLLSQTCNLHLSADVLSEDCILKWHKEAYTSKGKSVFLEQMKPFVEWLQNAEEGRPVFFQIIL